jgi:hypothetical protein
MKMIYFEPVIASYNRPYFSSSKEAEKYCIENNIGQYISVNSETCTIVERINIK